MSGMQKTNDNSSGKVLARARRFVRLTCHNPSCACFLLNRINGNSLNLCAIKKILNPSIDAMKEGKDEQQKSQEQDSQHAASQESPDSQKDNLPNQTDFSEKLQKDCEEMKGEIAFHRDPLLVQADRQVKQLTDNQLMNQIKTLRQDLKKAEKDVVDSTYRKSETIENRMKACIELKMANYQMKSVSGIMQRNDKRVAKALAEIKRATEKSEKAAKEYDEANSYVDQTYIARDKIKEEISERESHLDRRQRAKNKVEKQNIDRILLSVNNKQGPENDRITKVEEDLSNLKEDVRTLKKEVGILKQDVEALKKDVRALKQDVGVLKQDVGALKQDVVTIKQEVESHSKELTSIREVLASHGELLQKILEIIKINYD